MKIAVVVGHHRSATGAINRGYREHYGAAIIAALLADELSGKIIVGTLSEKIAQVNAGSFDAVVSVHLNAGGGRGSETLYHHTSAAGRALAEYIEKAQQDAGFLSRGAKAGWFRMDGKTPLAILSRTRPPAVLFEAFFMDGDAGMLGDLEFYQRRARSAARGVKRWWRARV